MTTRDSGQPAEGVQDRHGDEAFSGHR